MRTTILLSVLVLTLAGPSAAPADVDVPPEAVVGTLPFLDVAEMNRIYLDVASKGAGPFPLMLDTGATVAILSPLAARDAGVSVRKAKKTAYRRKTRLGRDLQFFVDTRTSDTGSKTGREYGVLGGDFLKHYVLEIDFASRAVRFLDPRRYSLLEVEPAPEQALLVLRDSPRPITTIAVGDRELPVLVDTGLMWPVLLSGKAARAAGIDVDALPPFPTMGTVLGNVELRLYHAPDVAIGGFHFADVPVLVAPGGLFGLGSEANDSVIGYDLLSRFLVRVDYAGRRMLLRRRSEQVVFSNIDYALTRSAGVFLESWPNGQRVIVVVPDSPAARCGLRAGDFIDGTSTPESAEAALRAIANGKPIGVKRQQGAQFVDVALEPSPSAAQP